jgi:carboxymethylenebutenolidase
VFYGPPPKEVTSIRVPVYGFYGGNDARIDATIPDTQTAMKTAGKKYDPVTYEGAGHGFMRAGEDPTQDPAKNEANKKAHDVAWQRWLGLLKSI